MEFVNPEQLVEEERKRAAANFLTGEEYQKKIAYAESLGGRALIRVCGRTSIAANLQNWRFFVRDAGGTILQQEDPRWNYPGRFGSTWCNLHFVILEKPIERYVDIRALNKLNSGYTDFRISKIPKPTEPVGK